MMLALYNNKEAAAGSSYSKATSSYVGVTVPGRLQNTVSGRWKRVTGEVSKICHGNSSMHQSMSKTWKPVIGYGNIKI